MGCEVSYFGQDNIQNVVGNGQGLAVRNKKTNPLSLIYSEEAYRKFLSLLKAESPDIVHLNNINFQITPSVIFAARKRDIPVVWTMHDPQLVCPCHRLYIEHLGKVCTMCIKGDIINCVKNRCFKGSWLRSYIGYLESKKYYRSDIYNYVSKFICPSRFMADMLKNRFAEDRLEVIRNYCKFEKMQPMPKDDYILYYGRLSEEKGLRTLLKAVPSYIKLKIAGEGPLENMMNCLPANIEYVGFVSGGELSALIQKAKFSIYPSEWYENCPFSIIESISFGTPVIGANIGGIPELIDDGTTGLLFEAGNAEDLRDKIEYLYNNRIILDEITANTAANKFKSLGEYCDELIKLYKNIIYRGKNA